MTRQVSGEGVLYLPLSVPMMLWILTPHYNHVFFLHFGATHHFSFCERGARRGATNHDTGKEANSPLSCNNTNTTLFDKKYSGSSVSPLPT